MDKNNHLHDLRHSAAHLLAQAIIELAPDAKLTIGPVTENGFFYDVLPVTNFKQDDLQRIEKKMRHIAKQNCKITGKQLPKDEARKLFEGNQFKLELIDKVPDDTVGVYWQGDFYDLCRGGHLESMGQVKHFKLTSISGSYWRADRDGIALQRISGIAFETREELDGYLKRLEDAKLYDHRRLGKQLDMFSFNDITPGIPFFHHKGLIVYNKLINFKRSLIKDDYQEIRTPMIMHESLWRTSGHYDYYKENMYFSQVDDQSYCIRPMNCPGAILVYKERPRSYRELPLRMAEFGYDHRYELSGVLHGLFRVRAFTQDDAHNFCTLDQLESEIVNLLGLAKTMYDAFSFTDVEFAVSTRPEKYMGAPDDWEKATAALINALDTQKIKHKIQEGEGAFYGPKIEIKIHDTMGREWQCGTIQVDFNQPENFDITYVASDQSRKRPIMIHHAMYGSVERFLGILLEHFKGRLPFWISPVQARVLTITDDQNDYADSIVSALKSHDLRAERDVSGDKISAKIRRAQLDKLPWMLVIGKKEHEQKTITLRLADGKQQFGLSLEDVLKMADDQNRIFSL